MAFKLGFLACAFIIASTYAQAPVANPVAEEVGQVCLGCICEAASGCNITIGCNGDVCGPFRITWAYWSDAGKHSLENEPNTSQTAYPNCVSDVACAAKTVQGYMARYAADCNGDGKINCDDYVRIHRHGGYGCNAPLDPKYENVYKECIKTFSQQ